jgi:hypothetical protein
MQFSMTGTMYLEQTASQLGLVDQIWADEKLMGRCAMSGEAPGGQRCSRLRSHKGLFRAPVAGEMARKEEQSVRELLISGTPKTSGGISKP